MPGTGASACRNSDHAMTVATLELVAAESDHVYNQSLPQIL